MHDFFSLQGKAALVTGGSRGLGRAMAVDLAAAGADVTVVDRTREQGVVDEIATPGR